MRHLTDLAWTGAAWRYPAGVPAKVAASIHQELALIEELDYPNYFLTVHDIVRWARGHGILCQGRGSAANSAVCYLPRRHRGGPGASTTCCSSASSPRSAASRRTSTWISSMSGARR